MKSYSFIAFACCLLAAGSCTKSKKTTSCTPSLYGYILPGTAASNDETPVYFGKIDLSTMTSTTSDSIPNTIYTNQGAFNTIDNCYYVFRSGWGWSTQKLLKITMGGVVTEFTNSAGFQYSEGLVYNQVTNKLYCLLGGSGRPTSVAEITISGSSYTVTPIVNAKGIADLASPATSTVNNSTGDMYFSMMNYNNANYSIEKYHPGASATTVIASGTGPRFLGLRFNPNDNMLYAIREDYTSGPSSSVSHEFIKIAPSGGMSALAPLSFIVTNELYSATLDPCNNRYIVTSGRTVKQLNMSGAIVRSDSTSGRYQGLFIRY